MRLIGADEEGFRKILCIRSSKNLSSSDSIRIICVPILLTIILTNQLQYAMIRLQSVTKYYGTLRALDDVSLHCPKGAALTLLGESASGKSTVLRALTGLIQPETGTIFIDGAPLTASILSAVRLRLGYVIQEGGLFPHLTAEDNVLLVARYLKRDADWMRRRIAHLQTMMQLPIEALRRYPAELSGGQRQRVALMRALMLEPDILLLDEPFSALDPLIRRDLQRDVLSIVRSLHITTVLVTHDIREAEMFTAAEGGVVAVMRMGRIVQQGRFEVLRSAPEDEFVRDFLTIL